MSFLAVIFLLASSATAAPCPSASGTPCTPTSAEKQKIIDTLDDAFKAEASMKAAASERAQALANGDAERGEALSQEMDRYEGVMKQSFSQALAQTEAAYNVGPRTPAGDVALPKDPEGRGAWITGYPARWRPEVRYELNEVRKILAPDGTAHFSNGTIDPAKVAGITYPDGEVRVLAQNLHNAFTSGNPGEIAYILQHEARHFDDLVSHGWNSKEADELRAYTDSVRDAAIFELSPEQTRRLDKLKIENLAALQSGKVTSFFADTRQELDLSIAYDQAQQQLALYKRRREEIRRLGAQAQANRLAQEARKRLMADYQASATGCGLTPIMTQGDKTLGFKAGRQASVYFTEPVTLEQAKAAMVMTRACWAGEGGQIEQAPCTDALGPMRTKWQDAGFRHGLELDADAGAYDGCLRAIRESSNPPADMKSINKLVTNYWHDWNVAAKRRAMDTMRKIARDNEEFGRQARGNAEERAGRVPDQSYDLTPARRALDEARRSHF